MAAYPAVRFAQEYQELEKKYLGSAFSCGDPAADSSEITLYSQLGTATPARAKPAPPRGRDRASAYASACTSVCFNRTYAIAPPPGLFIITCGVFLVGLASHAIERFLKSRPKWSKSGKVVADLSEGMNEAQMLVRVLNHLEAMRDSSSEATLKKLVAEALREHEGPRSRAVRPGKAEDEAISLDLSAVPE
jgi:hypothetical protein